MPEWSILVLFVLVALPLQLTPGPAVLYIVTRSMRQGRSAGLASTLGVTSGSVLHVVAAALGVSAVVASSTFVFEVLKLLGAAYLVYLGVRAFMGKDDLSALAAPAPRALRRLYLDGLLVNFFNPKTALFYFAFLPQFVDPAAGAVAGQILLFGMIFVAMGFVCDGLYALLSGALAERLRDNLRYLRLQRYLSGSIFIGLGVAAALVEGRGK